MVAVFVTYLRRTDIPSFAEFRNKVMESVAAEVAEILDAKKVITVPDYEQILWILKRALYNRLALLIY